MAPGEGLRTRRPDIAFGKSGLPETLRFRSFHLGETPVSPTPFPGSNPSFSQINSFLIHYLLIMHLYHLYNIIYNLNMSFFVFNNKLYFLL